MNLNKTTLVSLALVLVLAGVLILVSKRNRLQEVGDSKAEKTLNVSHNRSSDESHSESVDDPANTSSGTSTSSAETKAIFGLLNDHAGQMNRVIASRYVDTLRSDPPVSMKLINKLTDSEFVIERILGFYLALEIEGFSEDLAERVFSDGSVFVAAEVSDWLYLKGKFAEWKRFSKDAIAGMADSDVEEAVILLSERAGAISVSAGMASLNLGKSLPFLIETAFNQDPRFLATAEELLQLENFSGRGGLDILKTMWRSNPDGMDLVLREIIASSPNYSPVRWEAVKLLGRLDNKVDNNAFLAAYLIQNNEVELRDRIIQTINSTGEPTSLIEMQERLDVQLDQKNIPAWFDNFIGAAERRRDFIPDKTILNKSKVLLESMSAKDFSAERLIADINHLLWSR